MEAMATGASYCGPLGPAFPSHFSLLKRPSSCFSFVAHSYSSSSSARPLSAYSEAVHRRDICKNQSSVNTSMCSVSFTNPLVEGNPLPRHKIGTKQSWQEQAEVYKRNRMEVPNVKCTDGVVSITYCQMNTKKNVEHKPYEFSDGRNFDSKGNLTVPFTEMDTWKETISQAQHKMKTVPSYFDKGSERPPHDSNHLGQDKVHCDEAVGVRNAKLSQKPKSRNNTPPNVEKMVAKLQQKLDSNQVLAPNGMHDVTAEDFALDMNKTDGPKSRNNTLPNVEKRVAKPQQKFDLDQVPAPIGMHDVSAEDFALDLNKINGHIINGSSQSELLPEQGSTEVVQPKKTPNIRGELVKLYNKVLVVNSVPVARKVVQLLTNSYRHLVHACDTEVAKIDVKDETPVDHGEIICFSIYCGPEADFGNGKSCIWVDLLDGDGKKILTEFAPFFEDPSIKKVWHNYSFDSHIIENYGLKLSGFHADTMHMARLWDSSRRAMGGYSLEALTGDPITMSDSGLLFNEKDLMGKVSMKTIFGRKKLKKDGTEGKLTTIAPVEVLQREERVPWICYSALDAISTRKLYVSLRRKLSNKSWQINGKAAPGKSMLDFYEKYWRPFGELLAKMETEGMLVDRAYLAEMEKLAKREQEVAVNRFRKWASKYCPDTKYMNVGSDTQLRQLLFGGIQNRKNPDESLPLEKTFKVPNVDQVIEEGKKAPLKFHNITIHKIEANFPVEMYTASGWPSTSINALKILAGTVSAEFDFTGDAEHSESSVEVEGDIDASVDEISEKQEPEKQEVSNSAYGTALEAFDTEEEGREACHAIAALCEVCAIDSLISNFILPLQGRNISGKDERIHCSLNINTETGRLSARRPNLQNQPALEKDRYKIRQAFIAAPGNSLIVADYGQLELRILAHLANCKSMLEAFEAGGDFHSRTAMNMYAHIREAVETKQVLLEWDPQPGEDKPPVPLLKDAFGSERRKAKMLNFSIAYGKTPVGLARDWKVSLEEAKKTVELWYKERQEVRRWQEKRKEEARRDRCVRTLLGRARWFPSMETSTYAQRGHIERAAINTPVQGSAADVAMCAMLEISKHERLKELGWRLLLQVHDEVILEGPSESAEVAKAIVVECMSKPFDGKNILNVDLAVDAKCAQNWYAAK